MLVEKQLICVILMPSKILRDLGLFKKEDIEAYCSSLCVSCYACYQNKSHRFNYFMDWDPSALKLEKEIDARNSLLQFCAAESDLFSDITPFQVALNATLRHYPHEPGLLLLKNDIGDTPF